MVTFLECFNCTLDQLFRSATDEVKIVVTVANLRWRTARRDQKKLTPLHSDAVVMCVNNLYVFVGVHLLYSPEVVDNLNYLKIHKSFLLCIKRKYGYPAKHSTFIHMNS